MDKTLEKIEEIIKRKGVSYSLAKEALEKNNGDLLEAIIYIEDREERFEKQNKSKKTNENQNNNNDLLHDFFEKTITIKKGNIRQLTLPLWLFLIIFIFTFKFLIILLFIMLLFTDHEITVD